MTDNLPERIMASVSKATATLDGDEATFLCPHCRKKTTWPGYTADAFRAPLELTCAHCDEQTFFNRIVEPGRRLTVAPV
jgi:hypothetical protein